MAFQRIVLSAKLHAAKPLLLGVRSFTRRRCLKNAGVGNVRAIEIESGKGEEKISLAPRMDGVPGTGPPLA